MDEFFVGYLPVPPGMRRFIKRAVVAALVLAAGLAMVLVVAQSGFANSSFDYGVLRDYSGNLSLNPFPILDSGWLLVGTGKHGAAGLRAGPVRLKGERIQNGEDRGVEILAASVRPLDSAAPPVEEKELGEVEWTGEIVDSKCYFGVMNPGRGKVHRDCAARCIAGGIPPALLVRDAAGIARTALLVWPDVQAFIAEPVTVRGRLTRINGRLLLKATSIHRAP
jgi:hypothetical protein